MMLRPSHVVVGALALTATACGDHNNLAPVSTATVSLVNDTETPLSLADRTVLNPANARIEFGQASACVTVTVSNTARELSVTNDTTGQSIATPTISAGDNLLIVAFDGPADNIQLAVLSNSFTPSTTGAGLRFFNGISTAGPLFMQHNDDLTRFVALGAASEFISVLTDSALTTFSTATFGVVVDAGFLSFPKGKNSTVVLGPPAFGTRDPRFFTVQGC